MKKLILSIVLVIVLAACNTQKKQPLLPLKFLEGAQDFHIKDFFQASQKGYAVIIDSNDEIIAKFKVESSGEWSANKGTIKFKYTYNKDKIDYRTWLVTLDSDSDYTIVGHDFLEPAKGRQSGNVSELLYKMNYELHGSKSATSFVDKIYQVEKDSVIILTNMYREGKYIGKIISAFKSRNKNFITQKKVPLPIKEPIISDPSSSDDPDYNNSTPEPSENTREEKTFNAPIHYNGA
jgi:hypothetical protein